MWLALLGLLACGGASDSEAKRRDSGDTGATKGDDDDDDTETEETPADPELNVAFVFVTEHRGNGRIRDYGFGETVLENVNYICQREADMAGLPGTFRAWLSTSNRDALQNIGGEGP